MISDNRVTLLDNQSDKSQSLSLLDLYKNEENNS